MTFPRRNERTVDPERQEVFKFVPANAPYKGEVILVDGERCRVTRVKTCYGEPGVWTIVDLRVVPA